MARKPVKVITDLQVKKRIKKVDNNDNILFDVSGTLANGHVSSSLPLTASNIYTPGNLTVDGTINAKKMSITEVTTSVLYENSISASINALYDVSASNATAGQVLQWNGTNWVAADVAGSGGGDITEVLAGTNLSGGGISGSVTLNLSSSINLTAVTASYFSGTFIGNGAQLNDLPLSNYATLAGVSSSFTTPTQITGALSPYDTAAITATKITGALNSYATLSGLSASFTTKTQVTGALSGYALLSDISSSFATLSGVSSSFVTPSNVTSALSQYDTAVITATKITGALGNYSTLTGLSASFATLAGVSSSFVTPQNVTGALTNYATLSGVSSSFVTATQVTGALNSYDTAVTTATKITGALENYATLAGVSGTFTTPTQITGALSQYLTINGASSSFAELSDLTASNITNFTSDVRAQFNAGPNIVINDGVITGSASGASSVEVSGAITGALTNYATLIGVSSSFATFSNVTSALTPYALSTNVSSSFTTPSQVSGAITGALGDYATLVGISSSFVTPNNVTSALEPYALSADVSSSFAVPQQVTGAISNLASRAEVTGALGGYLLISAASSSFAELNDLTASNITNFTSDVRAQFSAGPNIVINNGVITGSASGGGLSTVETSGSITGSGVISNPVTLKDPLVITTLSASFISGSYITGTFAGNGSQITDITSSNINNFTVDVRSLFTAGPDIDISSGLISYTGAGGGGLTSVETSGSITGSGIVSNPVTLKDPLVIGTVTASLGFNGNLNGTASYATNAATASTSFIGAAEDGDYTDGLFTDITTTTPVGTIVDRFNEILKALAPSPAPSLSNLEKTSGATGTSMRLGFGTSPNEISGYTAVTASLTGLPNIAFANSFTSSNGSGGSPIRMGVYATPVTLTMSLNNSTTADASTYTNYPAKAFNVSTDGAGTYKLEVNGTEISPTGSTSTTGSATTQTFVLALANTASFTTSGQGLDIFRHRTGTVGVPTSLWRNGHNYAKVTHVSSLGTHVTNFVDWVYDPTGSSGVEAYTFTTPTSSSFSATGTKNLSGIKYFTSISYNFSSSVGNFYKNTYPTDGGLTFGSLTSGLSSTAVTVPTPSLNTDSIQVNSAHTFTSANRLLNSSLASTLTAANGLGKTGSTTLTTNTILYDNVNTANTTLIEQFALETYRASSGSYDTQASASNAIGAFPSSSSLSNGELAVYDGAVRYPTQTLNGGNVEGSSVVHKIASQPNYSGVSDNRGYFRVFQNGASSVASFTIAITGSSDITVIPYNTALGANSVRIWIKVPGKTGFRDISTSAPGSTSGIALNDNVGALQGSITTTSTTSQHTVNLLTEALAPSEYFLLKIEASSAFTNNISRITITGL